MSGSTATPPPRRTARRRTASRVLAAVVALAIVPTLVVGNAGTASALSTTNRSDAAAGWLGRQLTSDHVIFNDEFSFVDYGLTADVVLALDSAGVGKVAARKATKQLKVHAPEYTGDTAFENHAGFYAGSFAKLLNVAAAQNADPRHFGGSDRNNLIASLRSLECGSGKRASCPASDNGRFSDISTGGDFSNTIGQSLALIGLERTTKKGPSMQSVKYLRHQQCDNGSFPLALSTVGCTASVDATAFAVQGLLATGRKKATKAALEGAKWLKRQQNPNGSFTADGVRNANSTGLAGQALLAAGLDSAAARANSFLRSLQVGCGGKAANRGLVHYAKHADGDPVRATSQAVPALAGVGLADVTKKGALHKLPTLRC
jgi:hypothetical protein